MKASGHTVTLCASTFFRSFIAEHGLNYSYMNDEFIKLMNSATGRDAVEDIEGAVVHHGGAGTTAAGLRAGRPTVICPFGGDQPFWGQRVYALGVGCKPIPQRKLTAAKLVDAIRETIWNRTIRQNADVLGKKIRSEDGIADAIAVIESLKKH